VEIELLWITQPPLFFFLLHQLRIPTQDKMTKCAFMLHYYFFMGLKTKRENAGGDISFLKKLTEQT
jgi:hypothetical protein